jgi:hypothetical protein
VNSTTTTTIVQVLALVFGGGAVQLIIFLFRRRTDLRKTNTEADVNTSTVAVNYSNATESLVKNLLADAERYRGITERVQETVERLQREALDAQREFARQLDVAHGENGRLATRIAQLSTDLDIAHRQLGEYSARHYPDPHTRENP